MIIPRSAELAAGSGEPGHVVIGPRHSAGAAGRSPCLTIRDAPRSPWRGASSDVARRSWSAEYLDEFVDLPALRKLVARLAAAGLTAVGWTVEV